MKRRSDLGAPGASPASTPAGVPVEGSEVSQSDVDAFEQLARIRTELGDEEAKVVLKRRNAKGQLGALGVMAAVDFSIERVITDWGGGRYVAVIYKGEEKLHTVTFEVDESIPSRVPKEVVEAKPGHPGVADVQRLYSPPPEDPRIATLERMIQSNNDLMKTLLTAMVTRGNGGGDALETGLKIAEMIRTNAQPVEKPSFSDLKEIFLAGIEAKAAAEGGGDEGYGSVIKAFSGPIAKVLDHAMGGNQPRPVQPTTIAGASPVPMRQPAQPVALPPGVGWLVHLQPHLPQILAWAKAGKDPQLYAEVILDNVDLGAQMEIGQAAQDPNFVDKTLAQLPMFAPYSAWATAVLQNIKELTTGPAEGEPEDEEQQAQG